MTHNQMINRIESLSRLQRHYWELCCDADNIRYDAKLVVFSDDNPFDDKYNRIARAYQHYIGKYIPRLQQNRRKISFRV